MADTEVSASSADAIARNRQLLADYVGAWLKGDVEKGTSYYADDMIVYVAGNNALADTYRGKEAFLRNYIDRVFQITGGKWSITGVEDILASEERGALIVTERFERE